MAKYLSPEWFDQMAAAAADYAPQSGATGKVSLRETITGTPFGDVTYVVTIEGSKVSISRESDTVAEVTFTQDYATAQELHQGLLTTQDAFFAGRVRVAGHLNTLLEHADLLQGIEPAFSQVRSQTTY